MFNGMMPSAPSLADIAAVTGTGKTNGENSWTDGNGWWILIILFAIFGGWGNNGWNNCAAGAANGYLPNALTNADLQRGFDTQSILDKLSGVNNGLCDGFYAMNNSVLTASNNIQNAIQQGTIANMQNTYAVQNAIQADTIANMQNTYAVQNAVQANAVSNMQNTNSLQSQLSDCCCQNKQGQAQIMYQMATDTCSVQNAIANQTQQIIQNDNANYRALHDELVQSQLDAKDSKISDLQAQLQACNLRESQVTQNQYLINALKPAPVPAFSAANLYGPIYGFANSNGTCTGCNTFA